MLSRLLVPVSYCSFPSLSVPQLWSIFRYDLNCFAYADILEWDNILIMPDSCRPEDYDKAFSNH